MLQLLAPKWRILGTNIGLFFLKQLREKRKKNARKIQFLQKLNDLELNYKLNCSDTFKLCL